MKCSENVIITLKLRPGSRELDMELPAFMPIDELCGKITESLRAMNPTAFGYMSVIRAEHNGKPLSGTVTLANHGLWDGSILDVVMGMGGESYER